MMHIFLIGRLKRKRIPNTHHKNDSNMTYGNPLPIILKFASAMMAGNLFQQLYNMADTIIVGRFVGSDALAAVGSTGTLMFLIFGICQGITTGFSVLTSQRYGASDKEGTSQSVSNGILMAIVLILVMTALSLSLLKSLLKLMNTPEEIYDYAYTYISIICMGIVCMVLYNMFAAFLRAVGNSRIPVYFLLFSASLNIVLDLAFIILLGLGVAGAAIATVLSQGISASMCWVYIIKKVHVLRPGKKQWKLDRNMAVMQLKIGLPMGAMFGITASGTTVMQSAINTFGQIAVSAFTAAMKINTFLLIGTFSMGQTMTAYCGQNFGVRSIKRLREGIRAALLIMLIYSVVTGILNCALLKYIMPMFFNSSADMDAMWPYAWTYTWECAIMFFPLSCIFIFRNSMQGCGYAVLPTVVGIMEFVARVAASFIAIHIHSYAIAAGCDAIAWLLAGSFGAIAWIYVLRDLPRVLKMQ